MRTSICKKRLTYFRHLNWGVQPFQLFSGKLPHPWNGYWTLEIKEKHKRNIFVSYLLPSSFVWFFWAYLVQGDLLSPVLKRRKTIIFFISVKWMIVNVTKLAPVSPENTLSAGPVVWRIWFMTPCHFLVRV